MPNNLLLIGFIFIKLNSTIKDTKANYLGKKIDPVQLVNTCKREQVAIVSVECVYQYIWHNKKRAGSLYEHLRTHGKRYRKRATVRIREV